VVRLREARPRSFGGGLNYSSSEGVGADVFWEHRNLLGRQERLRFDVEGGELIQRVSGRFTKPNFARFGQDLTASQIIDQEDTDAFNGLLATTQAGIERAFGPRLKASAGGLFEYAALTDDTGEHTFALLGAPLAVTWDARDDILDPTRGVRVRAETTPFFGVLFDDALFLRNEVTASTYWAPLAGNTVVLAGRARLGSIVGDATADIPANRRFYAGGGGSLRGFAYQKAGPLDANRHPLGGRSVVEVGGEVRVRVFGDFGIVPFVEGGNVYDESLPQFGGRYLWSAGLGFRYYSPVGPVRLDLAVPLNPRDGDDSFQFYVSLGQAF
jgi:translocation and assembly module TamA